MEEQIKENEDMLQVEFPNEDKIACKNCKYTYGLFPLHKVCGKYKEKPNEIYFKNQKCPYFEQK